MSNKVNDETIRKAERNEMLRVIFYIIVITLVCWAIVGAFFLTLGVIAILGVYIAGTFFHVFRKKVCLAWYMEYKAIERILTMERENVLEEYEDEIDCMIELAIIAKTDSDEVAAIDVLLSLRRIKTCAVSSIESIIETLYMFRYDNDIQEGSYQEDVPEDAEEQMKAFLQEELRPEEHDPQLLRQRVEKICRNLTSVWISEPVALCDQVLSSCQESRKALEGVLVVEYGHMPR